ncbi:MAG: membrane protein insertion efficiency factor YidD [Bacillus subtilis]|nr:membrane protein insertion efficiency factor YidD [Bacillus subtilis]
MKQLAIKWIRWYQTTFTGRRPSCRYHPSCSNYAIDAFQKLQLHLCLDIDAFAFASMQSAVQRRLRSHP